MQLLFINYSLLLLTTTLRHTLNAKTSTIAVVSTFLLILLFFDIAFCFMSRCSCEPEKA